MPQFAVFDQLPRQADDRVVLIVVTHPRDHACRFRRLAHGVGLFKIDRQRLFAVHRFAGAEGGHGHGIVQVVGRGDGDQVDLGIIDQLLPGAVGGFEPPGVGAVAGTLWIGVGQGGEFELQGEFEHCTDIAKRQGMGAAHEACADETDTEFAHSRDPFGLLFPGGLLME
ncbi:hypothetical protein D3C87_1554080 [compost metagenome]